VASLVGGYGYECATLVDGTARCWGSNDNGRLGDGTTMDHFNPTKVVGLDMATQVATGLGHACARRGDGAVLCWGLNSNGQLGDGTNTDHLPPTAIAGLAGVIAIGAGAYHTCALHGNGQVQCWGKGGYLGDGSISSQKAPQDVPGLMVAKSLYVGGSSTFGSPIAASCVLLGDGSAQCWGDNSRGQLGDGGVGNGESPVNVTGLSGATELAIGGAHVCALMGDATVMCWGENGNGQLGDGTLAKHPTPFAVPVLTKVAHLTAGDRHTCAQLQDGTAQCWGENSSGELGRGATSLNPDAKPAAVKGLSGVTVLGASSQSTCAFGAGNVTYCWGNDQYGQLGIGDNAMSHAAPVAVAW
jgi:alpha-tubulin suppressor-like RCC1 family protein